MSEWRWVDRGVVLALHAQQLRAWGGGQGVREEGLLDSALARPQNLAAYGEPDITDLAASYAYGLAKNHAFVDGNKRTALVVCETFIMDNGGLLDASDAELAVLFEELADGQLSENEFAEWLRERVRRS